MKKEIYKIVAFMFGAIALMMINACKKPVPTPYINYGLYKLVATIQQDSAVLPLSTNGVGHFEGIYDASLKMLNYDITWTGLDSSVSSINLYGGAPADSNTLGLVTRNLFNSTAVSSDRRQTDSISGYITGLSALSDTEVDNLKNNRTYIVLSTRLNKNGEIRGRIVVDSTYK
ncbi:CHRD domain-containing protein [Parasediminibacterium sp. JCM 36343]|uniref:CHRD domain-containing protein n=1 Tax=Parasediminibacterium sp. JCM 36343 TaxID=3374279 RepID=UPI00397930F5